jgi:hypothetical protein
MKRSFLVFIRLLFLSFLILSFQANAVYADIAYPARDDGGSVFSLETLLCNEQPLSSRFSFLVWGGPALLLNITPSYWSWGGEAGIESRFYGAEDEFTGMNISLYVGTAVMDELGGGTSLGIIPGFKMTYSARQLSQSMSYEPYVSISLPYVMQLNDDRDTDWNAYFTIGFRFVLGHFPRGPDSSR